MAADVTTVPYPNFPQVGVKKRPSLFVVYTSSIATIVYVLGFLAFFFLIISDSEDTTELKDNGLFLPWLVVVLLYPTVVALAVGIYKWRDDRWSTSPVSRLTNLNLRVTS